MSGDDNDDDDTRRARAVRGDDDGIGRAMVDDGSAQGGRS